jgi:hypothetical protein
MERRVDYHGPHGETIRTDGSDAATDFLLRYKQAAEAQGREGRNECMRMLAAIVKAAGGTVFVPHSTLVSAMGDWELRVSDDPAANGVRIQSK